MYTDLLLDVNGFASIMRILHFGEHMRNLIRACWLGIDGRIALVD